mmetsp:Transcript_18190/g.50488  ORF Transcript_18190/g.50488 Transcript_18190/m.50488 type:complete len:126 (-) Transcript_18190:45-422(-)
MHTHTHISTQMHVDFHLHIGANPPDCVSSSWDNTMARTLLVCFLTSATSLPCPLLCPRYALYYSTRISTLRSHTSELGTVIDNRCRGRSHSIHAPNHVSLSLPSMFRLFSHSRMTAPSSLRSIYS